ncbi:MAG: hypothetical protein AMXMBFR13_16090 [Phycisphaerae bacterium]
MAQKIYRKFDEGPFAWYSCSMPETRGRPQKPSGERRANTLRIRLTPDERKSIDDAAKVNALEASTWARSVLIREAQKVHAKG